MPGGMGCAGIAREAVEEIGVGGVGERIAAGLHHVPGVEVAIGQRMVRVPDRVRNLAGSGVGGLWLRERERGLGRLGNGIGGGRTLAGRRSEAGEPLSKSGSGEHDAVQVIGFSGLSGAFDRDHFQRTNFGDDEDEARQDVGSDSRLSSVGLPVVFQWPSRQLPCPSRRAQGCWASAGSWLRCRSVTA